jgi:hypothetical protein
LRHYSEVGSWHFDKRDYMGKAPGKITPPPAGANAVVHRLIEMINTAIDEIPNWGI